MHWIRVIFSHSVVKPWLVIQIETADCVRDFPTISITEDLLIIFQGSYLSAWWGLPVNPPQDDLHPH